jgi:hypothetical protein
MIGIGGVLVLLVVILVLLSNPPNRWVEKISREKREDESSR